MGEFKQRNSLAMRLFRLELVKGVSPNDAPAAEMTLIKVHVYAYVQPVGTSTCAQYVI